MVLCVDIYTCCLLQQGISDVKVEPGPTGGSIVHLVSFFENDYTPTTIETTTGLHLPNQSSS